VKEGGRDTLSEMELRKWSRGGNSMLICVIRGMRIHRMHSLWELEEVSEQTLPWAFRGHSP
jgi:hypothetical protein